MAYPVGRWFSPGELLDLQVMTLGVVQHAIVGVTLAVRIAYPIMSAVLVGHVALGMLGRSAPQLNLSSVGFTVTIVAGTGIFYLIAPMAAELVARESRKFIKDGFSF